MRSTLLGCVTSAFLALVACHADEAPGPTDGGADGGPARDGGGEPRDGGSVGADTSVPDATAQLDAGTATDSGGLTLDGGAGDCTYATTFPADESPISEGGAWSAAARPWLRVRSVGGIAKADDYVTGYDDNYALLDGIGPNVEITATVYVAGSAPFGEVLLLARMADTPTTIRGYEFLYDGDGSVQLMRWNGPSGDFTPMGGETGPAGPLADDDQLRMRVVGSTITIFHRRSPGDWVQIGETTDATFADGRPGLGFFVRDLGQSIDNLGFRDYCVRELP